MYLPVFIQNLFMHLGEKILLLLAITFRGVLCKAGHRDQPCLTSGNRPGNQGGQARLKLVIVLLCGGTRRCESAQLCGGGASIAPQCVARVRELACRPDHEPLQAHGACWLLLGRERPRGSGGRPRGRPGRAEAQRASLHRRVAEPVGCLSSLDALLRSQIHVAQVYSEFQLVLRTRL